MTHIKKTPFLLYIIPLMLSALACGATIEPEVFAQKPVSTETAQSVNTAEMVVSGLYPDEPLNIRNGAGGTELGKYLHNGDVVTIYQSTWNNDVLWCAIEPMYTRWVACRYLKGK